MSRSFLPKLPSVRDLPVAGGLVFINCLIFAVMAASSGSLWHLPGRLLIAWGANFGPQTLGGEPWRLVTSLFIHGGLLHVGLNMLALWQVGLLVEKLFGSRRFLALYLGAGLVASIASVWWRPAVNSVGASGAIFGVIAALLVDLLLRRDLLPRAVFRRIRSGLLSFLGFSLFAGLALPGIDNAAHLGGLVGGALLGYALAPQPPAGRRPDPLTRLTAALAVVGLAAAAWVATPAPRPVHPVGALVWPAPPAASSTTAEDALQAFAVADADLAHGYDQVQEGVRRGRLSAGEAARIIEEELLPGWERQMAQLAGARGQGGAGDWRLPTLTRYARLRHDALEALLLAVRTRNGAWLASSNQLQRQADNVLLNYRLREAQERAIQGRERPSD